MTRHLVLVLAMTMAIALSAQSATWQDKLDPRLSLDEHSPSTDVLIFLSAQADLDLVRDLDTRQERGRLVYALLQETAAHTQSSLRQALEQAGVTYRSFWICNAIAVPEAAPALLSTLAQRDDVERIASDPKVALVRPEPTALIPAGSASRTIPWNIDQIGAPEVWATGNTGQSGVVGILDSGCDWQHPAVRDQYRGWTGDSVDHDYNWYDAVHESSRPCGPDSPEPCDDLGHGTHILGTAVGDDGQGMQIGVAPGARWIACRCLDGAWSSPSMFFEGFEWMMAPRPVGGGPGDPDRAPDVVTTAWYCPPSLCSSWDMLLPAVAALRAAGIMVVGTAGGNGPGCGSIMFPPAIYDETYTVGVTDQTDGITSFSGRGPVISEQGTFIKPDLSAPGVDILSCLPDGVYSVWSGGAMANAHGAGAVALVVTALPALAGQPDAIEARLNATAVPLTSNQCGDGVAVPNNVYGHGRLDVAAACDEITAVPTPPAPRMRLLPNEPNPFNPRTTLVYELDQSGTVNLHIHDLAGKLIRVLKNGVRQAAGQHRVLWDGRDDRGCDVAAGVYLSCLQSGETRAMGRMVLIR